MKSNLLLGIAICAAGVAPAGATPHYRVTKVIPGPDGGGWDYAKVDDRTNRLYIARSSSVTVVDTVRAVAVGSIGKIAHGHAVVPLGDGRLLVTSGDDASVRFLGADGRQLTGVRVGAKPDAAILSKDGRMAYVMNADAGTVSVIDLAAMRVRRTITVKPALEYAALSARGELFINDEDANEVEVVDAGGGGVVKSIPLTSCEAPSGLGYDRRTDRLIAACANGKAAIIDARTRRVAEYVDIGRGPDAVVMDPVRRLAFVPCGKDGVLDVLSLDGRHVRRVQSVKTAVGARTAALDQRTGRVFLPVADLMPAASASTRPSPVQGTFRVLVVDSAAPHVR